MSGDSSRKAERAFLKKGFVRDNRGDRYYRLYVEGSPTHIRTMMSHGSDMDLDDWLIAKMSKQLYLTKRQFVELIECPLSGEAYLELLRKAGELRG